ncbi:SseB family protein [Actinocatenispora comari]|uniref:SseB protein N-terminal domain-containing protein n=1 Tax=Actinocatenispora comari TaxID=2807577 RepID=A0A8J4ALE6_9ACTN|nr:SseB family protein [Actinocatenispora comari]GIL31595.1 hypothetical protein NUM_68490 [Actinocatenispora comari]
MADEWQPANDVERALLDAMQRGEQDRYFEVLGAADLILPFAADATGAAQPGTWATWGYEGRTYILAFTSQQALASIMGRPTDQFRTGRLAEICAWWPDESWWLAVDFGLPIAGYLPGTFVSQLTGVQLGAQLAVSGAAAADPTVAYRPGEQDAAGQQADPLQTQQAPTPPADPGQTVPAAPADPGQTVRADHGQPVAAAAADPGQPADAGQTAADAGATAPPDAAAQPASAQPYQQPTAAQPGQQPTSAQPDQQGGAQPYQPYQPAQPHQPAQPYESAQAYESGRQQAYPPADAAAQYQQQAGAAAHAGPGEQASAAGAQPGTVPVLSSGSADAAGFRPASPLEQTLLDASRTGDRKTFMDALLGAYLLVPVPEGASPGPTAVTTPDFPWPSIERNGTPQVPVFTSQERMRERVGAAPYAVVPFVLIVEHWPHREWYLALNPDTPVSATVDGDQIAELAEWARRTHLAERLGVLPPQQPLVPAQPTPVSAQPASDQPASDLPASDQAAADPPASDRTAEAGGASPWSAPADAADRAEDQPAQPDGSWTPSEPPSATNTPDATEPGTPGSDGAAATGADDGAAAGSAASGIAEDSDGSGGQLDEAGAVEQQTADPRSAEPADDQRDGRHQAGDAPAATAAGDAGAAAGEPSEPDPGAPEPDAADGPEPDAASSADTASGAEPGESPATVDEASNAVDTTAVEQASNAVDTTAVEQASNAVDPVAGDEAGPADVHATAEGDASPGAGDSARGATADDTPVPDAGSSADPHAPTDEAAAGAHAPIGGPGSGAGAATAEAEAGAATDGSGTDAATGESESGAESVLSGSGAAAEAGESGTGEVVAAAAGGGPTGGGAAGAPPQDDGEPAPEWPPVPPAIEDEPAPAEPVPSLSFPALLQKVLPDAQVPFYLERHFDRVGGWIHPVAEAPVRAGDLRVATGLSTEVAAEPVHAIRWHVEAEQLLPVLAAVRSTADPELVEYRVPTARLPHGAELYRIDPDGETTVLAVFNADHHRWHPLI